VQRTNGNEIKRKKQHTAKEGGMNKRLRTNEHLRKIIRMTKFSNLNFVLYYWKNRAGEWMWKAMVDTNPVTEVIDKKLLDVLKRLAGML
jgi:hypothetical protein